MDAIRPVFHHVTLKTRQLSKMIDWYLVVLGGKVNFRDEHNAWTTNDAANHRVAFLSVPGLQNDPEKVAHIGMHHSAFEYASFADLFASYDRMKQVGITPAFCLDHGLTVSLYYEDPDSNFVELQSDCFGDWAVSTEWMQTSPEFKANPIGVPFDPEQVSQRVKAGETYDTLRDEIRSGKFPPVGVPNIGLPAGDAADTASVAELIAS